MFLIIQVTFQVVKQKSKWASTQQVRQFDLNYISSLSVQLVLIYILSFINLGTPGLQFGGGGDAPKQGMLLLYLTSVIWFNTQGYNFD